MSEETTSLSPTERGKRLKQLRDMAKLTRRELNEISGYGGSTIQYWENGQSKGLSHKEAIRFIDVFQKLGIECSIAWLYYGEGFEPVKLSPAAKKKLEQLPTSQFTEELQLFNALYPDAVVLMLEDDCMLPFYQAGDWVGGIKTFGENINMLVNQRCIVEVEEGILLCRVLKFSERSKTYNLIGTNVLSNSRQLSLDNVKIISAAPVIWHRSLLSDK